MELNLSQKILQDQIANKAMQVQAQKYLVSVKNDQGQLYIGSLIDCNLVLTTSKVIKEGYPHQKLVIFFRELQLSTGKIIQCQKIDPQFNDIHHYCGDYVLIKLQQAIQIDYYLPLLSQYAPKQSIIKEEGKSPQIPAFNHYKLGPHNFSDLNLIKQGFQGIQEGCPLIAVFDGNNSFAIGLYSSDNQFMLFDETFYWEILWCIDYIYSEQVYLSSTLIQRWPILNRSINIQYTSDEINQVYKNLLSIERNTSISNFHSKVSTHAQIVIEMFKTSSSSNFLIYVNALIKLGTSNLKENNQLSIDSFHYLQHIVNCLGSFELHFKLNQGFMAYYELINDQQRLFNCLERAASLSKINKDGCQLKYKFKILELNVEAWNPLGAIVNFQECFNLINEMSIYRRDENIQKIQGMIVYFGSRLATFESMENEYIELKNDLMSIVLRNAPELKYQISSIIGGFIPINFYQEQAYQELQYQLY